MERITVSLPKVIIKTGPKGKPLNQRWEEARSIAEGLHLPIGMLLRYIKKDAWAVERSLMDLAELAQTQEIRSKKGYFIFLFKKHSS